MTERWSIHYRPKRFSEVVGQTPVVRFCSAVLSQFYNGKSKLPVGFLFGGRSGVGKTTLARVIGASLNCEHKDGVEPCGECPSCLLIVAGEGGVMEVDASFFGSVDNIRHLRAQLSMYSLTKYQVVILDEVHMMSREAFNVLLKLLEEPTEGTLYVLCTTEPQKVLETVRSRLIEFRFTAISWEEVGVFIKNLLEKEGVSCEEKLYKRLYRLSNENLRDVIVSLEQLSRLGDGVITYGLTKEVFGDIFVFEDVLKAIGDGDFVGAVELYQAYRVFYSDFSHFLSRLLSVAGDYFVQALKSGSSDAVFYEKVFSASYKFIQKTSSLIGDASAKMFFFALASEAKGSVLRANIQVEKEEFADASDVLSILGG